MTTDADNLTTAAGSGGLLRETREQRQFSIEDVAHTLRLTPQIIEALESGDFTALGPAVFVRGYLRNYAKLLELSPHLVLAESPSAEVEPEAFRTMSIRTEIKPGINLHGWLLGALLALLVLAVLLVMLVSKPDSAAEPAVAVAPNLQPSAVTEPAAQASGVSASAASVDPEPSAVMDILPNEVAAAADSAGSEPEAAAAVTAEPVAGESTEASMATESETDAAATPPAEAATPGLTEPGTTSSTGKVPLRLTFTDECWVEIADSRRSLLYGLEKGGSVVDLEGVPPFRIFVGNREAVQVAIAGKPFTIPPGSQDDGNTARFTVDEVGQLR